jgi:hypothetical protein
LSLEWSLELHKQWLFETDGGEGSPLAETIRRETSRERELRSVSREELLSLYRQEIAADPLLAGFMIQFGQEESGQYPSRSGHLRPDAGDRGRQRAGESLVKPFSNNGHANIIRDLEEPYETVAAKAAASQGIPSGLPALVFGIWMCRSNG